LANFKGLCEYVDRNTGNFICTLRLRNRHVNIFVDSEERPGLERDPSYILRLEDRGLTPKIVHSPGFRQRAIGTYRCSRKFRERARLAVAAVAATYAGEFLGTVASFRAARIEAHTAMIADFRGSSTAQP
jgi:hypothetical protein